MDFIELSPFSMFADYLVKKSMKTGYLYAYVIWCLGPRTGKYLKFRFAFMYEYLLVFNFTKAPSTMYEDCIQG
jgi:hypothetical protein